ncbi:hypothetical protein HF329_14970 [Chitinophaga oryzae]|uniref:Glycyl-tRNA synthetase subunit alpha n=1 Tax=Chitinophaga oryzae TaxID=2725414 RepID=A0AAE6ZJI0_9BACT|nr:hypothetical protein [Chitinophaga oryzae]QJB32554.1 hypothetical protein HF329_14970 [Chitinophaga oryzae]
MKVILIVLLVLSGLTTFGQQALHIYGGKGHDVYLGCLNCDNYNANSVWNAYGTYGSRYNAKSIWNSYGDYGSEYSSTSPFNPYAGDPPVVVDKDGGFYGYFTVNEYNDKRANFKLALTIYKFYDLIRDDVAKWYDKIFR